MGFEISVKNCSKQKKIQLTNWTDLKSLCHDVAELLADMSAESLSLREETV